MKNKKITSSAVPKNSYDLINKLYVDGLIVDYALKTEVDEIKNITKINYALKDT